MWQTNLASHQVKSITLCQLVDCLLDIHAWVCLVEALVERERPSSIIPHGRDPKDAGIHGRPEQREQDTNF